MKMWSQAIDALSPYDDFTWNKYFAAIQKLDEFNWAACVRDDKNISALSNKTSAWWIDFWSQEGAKEILEKNAKEHEAELGLTVVSLQTNWHSGKYKEAGKNYGAFWSILIGAPD